MLNEKILKAMIKSDHLIPILSSINDRSVHELQTQWYFTQTYHPCRIIFFSPLYATNNAASFSPELKRVLLRNNEHISDVLTKAQRSVVAEVESLSLITDCNYSHVLMQAPTKVAKSTRISLFYREIQQKRLLHMKMFTRWHSSFAYINRKLWELFCG